MDVVVGKGATVLELFSGKDQTLLVRGNAFLVLDLRFNIVDGIGGLDLEGDGLPREGLDEAIDSKSVGVLSNTYAHVSAKENCGLTSALWWERSQLEFSSHLHGRR